MRHFNSNQIKFTSDTWKLISTRARPAIFGWSAWNVLNVPSDFRFIFYLISLFALAFCLSLPVSLLPFFFFCICVLVRFRSYSVATIVFNFIFNSQCGFVNYVPLRTYILPRSRLAGSQCNASAFSILVSIDFWKVESWWIFGWHLKIVRVRASIQNAKRQAFVFSLLQCVNKYDMCHEIVARKTNSPIKNSQSAAGVAIISTKIPSFTMQKCLRIFSYDIDRFSSSAPLFIHYAMMTKNYCLSFFS